MAANKWGDKKLEAKLIYETEGLATAINKTGIPKGTIAAWASREKWKSVQTSVTEQTRAANEVNEANLKERKLGIAGRIASRLEETLDDMRSTKSADRKNLAVVVGVLFDKLQLATGGATSRSDSVAAPRAEKEERLADIIGIKKTG
jgi:hypothetical protein